MVADRPLLEVVSHMIGFHLFQVSSKELLHTAKAGLFFSLLILSWLLYSHFFMPGALPLAPSTIETRN